MEGDLSQPQYPPPHIDPYGSVKITHIGGLQSDTTDPQMPNIFLETLQAHSPPVNLFLTSFDQQNSFLFGGDNDFGEGYHTQGDPDRQDYT